MRKFLTIVIGTILIITLITGCGVTTKNTFYYEPSVDRQTMNIRRVTTVPNRLPLNMTDPEKGLEPVLATHPSTALMMPEQTELQEPEKEKKLPEEETGTETDIEAAVMQTKPGILLINKGSLDGVAVGSQCKIYTVDMFGKKFQIGEGNISKIKEHQSVVKITTGKRFGKEDIVMIEKREELPEPEKEEFPEEETGTETDIEAAVLQTKPGILLINKGSLDGVAVGSQCKIYTVDSLGKKFQIGEGEISKIKENQSVVKITSGKRFGEGDLVIIQTE